MENGGDNLEDNQLVFWSSQGIVNYFWAFCNRGLVSEKLQQIEMPCLIGFLISVYPAYQRYLRGFTHNAAKTLQLQFKYNFVCHYLLFMNLFFFFFYNLIISCRRFFIIFFIFTVFFYNWKLYCIIYNSPTMYHFKIRHCINFF